MQADVMSWADTAGRVPRQVSEGFKVWDIWQGVDGAKAQVVEIAAGACYPQVELHEPGPEEVYVVSGVFNDGERDYPAGSFIHCPAGSRHVPQSRQGCRLFLFYPRG